MASEVTLLLARYRDGDGSALDSLAKLIYPELKAMARRRTNGADGFGATVLVNETFAKLLSGGALKPTDRQQFFALAATIMRQVIIDEIRYVSAQKRDGKLVTYSDTQAADKSLANAEFLLQVDQMLEQLENENPKLARVFECRYFAGFSTTESAEALGVSVRSVERMWAQSRERIAEMMNETSP